MDLAQGTSGQPLHTHANETTAGITLTARCLISPVLYVPSGFLLIKAQKAFLCEVGFPSKSKFWFTSTHTYPLTSGGLTNSQVFGFSVVVGRTKGGLCGDGSRCGVIVLRTAGADGDVGADGCVVMIGPGGVGGPAGVELGEAAASVELDRFNQK